MARVRGTEAPVRVSLTNALTAAGVTITGSSELTESPASRIASPAHPMLPWRTTALGAQNVVVDFLTAQAITGLWLIYTNFTTVTIQGNATNVWTSPSYSTTWTISRNPWNFRHQLVIPLVGFAFRYLRILIPSQTPVDGSTGYLLGGVYAGTTETLPQNFRFDISVTTIQPAVDVAPQHGGWRQRNILGEPLARLTVTREAKTTRLVPGYGDDLARWQDLTRRIRIPDIFAIRLGATDSSQGFIVRSVDQDYWKWTRRTLLRAESVWTLEEAMAG